MGDFIDILFDPAQANLQAEAGICSFHARRDRSIAAIRLLMARSLSLALLVLPSAWTLAACDQSSAIPAGDNKGNTAPAEQNLNQKAPEKKKSDGLSPQEVTAKCRAICEKTKDMPCAQAESCMAACEETFGLPTCRGEFGAMLSCTESTPVEGFVCGDEQAPALAEGRCEAEQESATRCVERLMQSGKIAAE
jgi:hypothetical protein